MNNTIFSCGWQHESFRLEYGRRPSLEQNEMKMTCCRNDFAAASLVINSYYCMILLVENHARFSEYEGFGILRAEVNCPGIPDVSLSRVQMHADDDKVWRGDALADWGSEPLKPWVPAQLFLRASVPADIKPGVYKGSVRLYVHWMFEEERLEQELPFEIEVAEPILPSGKERTFHLAIWQHPSNIARKHEVPLFSDRHFEILEEYTRTLSEMGNVVATVQVGEIPWAGQFCYRIVDAPAEMFEYSMVTITKKADGTFSYDFSVLQRYLELCDKYDMAREIQLYGLIRNWLDVKFGYGNITEDYPDAVRFRYTDEADGCSKYMKKTVEIRNYITALYEWLKEQGWLERCQLAADEPPDMEAYLDAMKEIKSLMPDIKLQMDVCPAILDEREKFEFDCYDPLLSEIAENEAKDPGVLERVLKRVTGKKVFSLCCTPWIPNLFLCSPLLEGRLHGPLAEWLHFDGFLRWAYTCWPASPREDITYRTGNCSDGTWPAGDTCLVYPTNGGHVMFSLRYFALKRGIGDFELMQMVKRECPNGSQIVEQALAKMIRQPKLALWQFDVADGSQYSLTPEDYDEARALLTDALFKARTGVERKRS